MSYFEERPDVRDLDPANLLPFECHLRTESEKQDNVERLPKAYVGTDQKTYGGTTIY